MQTRLFDMSSKLHPISSGKMQERSSSPNQSGIKPNLVAKILATKIGNLWAFSQSDIRAIISAPYLFGVVTFVLFAVATPNKYGDLLFESRVTSRRLRE